LLHNTNITEFFGDLLHHFQGDFRIMNLPAPELNADIYFFIVLQPSASVANFKSGMVFIGLGPQANFFDFNVLLSLLGLLTLLFLFVEEFTQIHHLADWWIGIGRNFDQIKFCILGNVLGFF